jgi:hypothetical protein
LLDCVIKQCNLVLFSDLMEFIVFELLNVIELSLVLMKIEISIVIMIFNKISLYLFTVLNHCRVNLKVFIEDDSRQGILFFFSLAFLGILFLHFSKVKLHDVLANNYKQNVVIYRRVGQKNIRAVYQRGGVLIDRACP